MSSCFCFSSALFKMIPLWDTQQQQGITKPGHLNFPMLPNWNATDTMRKQILFANYRIRNSGTGLTTLGSYLIILTHASSRIWIEPRRPSVLLLKRSICLCTSLNWTESFKWCCLRKVFRTSFFFSLFPLFLRPKRLSYWNSLQLKKSIQGPNHRFYK